jgi:hypothetical protein
MSVDNKAAGTMEFESSFGAEIVVDSHDTVTLPGVTVAQLQAAQTAHVNWLS